VQRHQEREDATTPRLAAADPDVRDVVMRVLRDSLHLDVEDQSVDLIEAGLLDSLAVVELLFELERALKVKLLLEELEVDDFRSVEQITRFVTSRAVKAPRP
jgi:D-alanine--poly(phosphoribitol) ligase subunit 2